MIVLFVYLFVFDVQDELDDLFLQQATVRSELMDSQFFLQNSTQNLEKLMKELDQEADLVT